MRITPTVAGREASADDEARRRGLLRVLGVVFGMAVTFGITVGMGILRTPGEVARQLPDAWLIMGAWLVGGLYALLGAVSVAELGTTLPRSGGFYVFARHALGDYAGFVVGWSDWLSTCGTLAAVALVIGEYTGALVESLRGQDARVGVAVIAVVALLQWRGVRWGSRAQELTSLLKTLAFAALIVACFALGGGDEATRAGAAATVAPEVPAGLAFVTASVLALQGVIVTYDGWYCAVYFGEEVRDPGRAIPRAMIGSVLLIIAVYMLVNLALLYVLPVAELAGDKLAVGSAAGRIFGERGATVISALAAVSMLAAVNASTMSAPRILFAMAGDRLFWRSAARVNRGGTPTVALLLSTVAAVLMILFSRTFERLLAALAFFFVVDYALVYVSVFVLRRREPERPRPFRAWGYPWTTAAALVGSVAFLCGAIASDTENSLYALLLLAASYPAFILLRRSARERNS
ncbi:MAG TPA: APC family permease [Pyrinomonadaceae bacterium]|nr:APC family permease [Pyrinomonadaceae bacterium]